MGEGSLVFWSRMVWSVAFRTIPLASAVLELGGLKWQEIDAKQT